jgi:hypothetical protein
MRHVFRFKHLVNAISFADHATKPYRIIMGENRQYWVVTHSHAEVLISQGFEEVERGI